MPCGRPSGVTRQHEPKRRGIVGGIDFEAATVRPCDRSRDEQAETKSPAATRILTARAERLEHPRQHLLRNRAPVMHLDDYLLRVSGQANTDRISMRPVLNSIGHEIRERLDDSMFVPR